MVLYRVGARVWIARIMITWGLVSAAMSLVTGPTSFYGLRFLLGAAEAGFFPGIAFYFSTWFPSEYRTRIIAWFMVAIPISTVIGSPLSGLLLAMDGTLGLAGWQLVFLVEGLPVVLVGMSVLWLLPDRPDDAAWLTDEDRRIVRERLEAERRPKEVRLLRRRSGISACGCWGACSSAFSSPRTGSCSSCRRYWRTRPRIRSGGRIHHERHVRLRLHRDDSLGATRGSRRRQDCQPDAGVCARRRRLPRCGALL